MILDMLLNESLENQYDSYEPIVLSEANYYTGDDSGMSEICLETEQEMIKLDEALMLCEQMAKVQEIKGNYNKAMMLQEGAIGDFFKKVVEKIKEMFNKVKTFFANLFKNIEVGLRDIVKMIDKYKDELNTSKKDFGDYEYRGHAWKQLKAEQYSANALKLKDAVKIYNKNLLSQIEKASKTDTASKNLAANTEAGIKAIEDQKIDNDEIKGQIIGQSKNMDLSEVRIHIEDDYRGEEKPIKGFSENSLSNMITFIKQFKNNKVLNKLASDTDKIFKGAIDAAREVETKLTSAFNDAKSDSSSGSMAKKGLVTIKHNINSLTSILNSYNAVMGICITLEKERFNEYKRAVVGAIRYKPKKK